MGSRISGRLFGQHELIGPGDNGRALQMATATKCPQRVKSGPSCPPRVASRDSVTARPAVMAEGARIPEPSRIAFGARSSPACRGMEVRRTRRAWGAVGRRGVGSNRRQGLNPHPSSRVPCVAAGASPMHGRRLHPNLMEVCTNAGSQPGAQYRYDARIRYSASHL
jgi:hypothetical protein